MKDKTLFIADADSPTGQAVALLAARQGMRLILRCSKGSPGEALAQQLHASGTRWTAADIPLNRDGLEALLEQVRADPELGRIDAMLCNAFSICPGSLESLSVDAIDDSIEDNLVSTFVCTQVIGAEIARGTNGRIIYQGSIHCDKPNGVSPLYSIAMGAVKNLSREAALYYGVHGVQVNYVELGPLEGDDGLLRHSALTTLYEGYEQKIPAGKAGTAADFAQLVLFLLSPQCSYVNGAEIRMDGGLILHYMDRYANERCYDRKAGESV